MNSRIGICPSGHFFMVVRTTMEYDDIDYVYCRYCGQLHSIKDIKFKEIISMEEYQEKMSG